LQRKCQRGADRKNTRLAVALSARLPRWHLIGHERDSGFAGLVRREDGTGQDAARVPERETIQAGEMIRKFPADRARISLA